MSSRWSVRLPSDATSPREARRFVAARLAEAGFGDEGQAKLIVSELVTNVVEHGGGTARVTVRVTPGKWAQLEVRDDMAAPGQPLAFPSAPPPADAEGGRGLLLVSKLSATSGTDGHGTTWARLPWAAAPVVDDGALSSLPAAGGGAW
jgi:anti-sigma regulatory factor (Ser/Thr protein kinase)